MKTATVIARLTFVAVLVHSLTAFSQQSIECDPARQMFSILRDGHGTALGAEILICQYPTNAFFGELPSVDPRSDKLTPEQLVRLHAMHLSAGDIESVLEQFAPGDRDEARKMYADPRQLSNLFTNVHAFRFLTRAEFGSLKVIRYLSSSNYLSSSTMQRRMTLTAYVTEHDGKNVFLVQPPGVRIFSMAASAFPHWKAPADREISSQEQAQLLRAEFTHNGDSDSRVVVMYRLSPLEGGPVISHSTNALGQFMQRVIQTYREYDTNKIQALWADGFDQNVARGLIQSQEAMRTSDYFRNSPDFIIPFYIKSADAYWVYLSTGVDDENRELRLIRLLRQGDSFKMTYQHSDVFADRILSSDEMRQVLSRQLSR